MKQIIVLSIALLVSMHAFSQDKNQIKSQKIMDRAKVLYEKAEHEKSFKLFVEAAELGNVKAMYNIGLSYLEGEGVEQNTALGVDWVKKSADAGYDYAQFNLGIMYQMGMHGLAEDHNKAMELLEKAALQGQTDAQVAYGEYYALGYLVPQDYTTAIKWFTKAYEADNANAAYYLGICYENGYGVQQDLKKAFEIYSVGANKGSSMAQYNLGGLYMYGKGIPVDEAMAFSWYLKSAQLGYAPSQFNVAMFYKDGIGTTTQDKTQALDWFNKAAAQGYQDAIKAIEEMKLKSDY